MWGRTPGRPWCCLLVLRWLLGGGGLACKIELPQAYRAVDCEDATTNSTCFVVCADGWTLRGDMQQITCLASGEFSSELPVCEPNACAPPVESPEINTALCRSLTMGEVCTVVCADGYAGNASSYTCLASGYLHGTVPRCEPRVCPVPDLQGLQHTCGSVRVGSECSVFCDEGYECESGTVPRWECAWDPNAQDVVLRGDMPRCRPQPCEYNLPEGDMYEHNCTGVRTGESCTWACASGYLGAPTSHVCLPSRWLSIGNPSCTAATCPGLSDPRFAGSCSVDTPLGEACLAVCAPGYRGFFPTQLRCVLDGDSGAVSLQGGLPDCTPKVCISGMPLGAQYDTNDCSGVTTHSVCTVQCAPGWEGAPANFTCGGDSHLEGTAPTCTPVPTFTATTALRTTTTLTATSGTQPGTTTTSVSTSYRATATATATSTATASTTLTTTPLSAADPAITDTSTTTTDTSATTLNLFTSATAAAALNLTTTPVPNMTTSTSANSEMMHKAPVEDQKVVDVRRLAVMAAVLGVICSTVVCGTFLYHLARRGPDDDGILADGIWAACAEDGGIEDEERIRHPHATTRPVWCDYSRHIISI